jgi:hypothetical protein
LIDDLGMMVSQRDTHPGLGNFPSSQWEVGDRFVESIRLLVPETAYTPADASLSVGFYAPIEGYRLAVSDAEGSRIGDAFGLEKIHIESSSTLTNGIPETTGQNFGDDLLLTGYQYSQREVEAGDVLTVSLLWQALDNDLPDYAIQMYILDENGKIVGDRDSRPQDGGSNTSTWNAGDVVLDNHNLYIGKSLPPGHYRVQVALLDSGTGQRQNILAEDGHWINNKIYLAGFRILP